MACSVLAVANTEQITTVDLLFLAERRVAGGQKLFHAALGARLLEADAVDVFGLGYAEMADDLDLVAVVHRHPKAHRVVHPVYHLLVVAHGEGGHLGDAARNPLRLGLKLVGRHHLHAEADRLGLLRRDRIAREDQQLGHLRIGEPGDHTGGHRAVADFRLAELGVLRGDHDVAPERQLAAAPQAVAVHRGDHWLGGVTYEHLARQVALQAVPPLVERAAVALAGTAKVGARAERTPCAREDDRPDGVVGARALEGGHDLARQRGTERVQLLRSIQRDPRDVLPRLVKHQTLRFHAAASTASQGSFAIRHYVRDRRRRQPAGPAPRPAWPEDTK